jgi:hypothetical protein
LGLNPTIHHTPNHIRASIIHKSFTISNMSSLQPSFTMTDFAMYLHNHGIQDFAKRKNGLPNMSNKMNKKYYEEFVDHMNTSKVAQKVYQSYNTHNTKSITPFECVICMETIHDNMCKLKCSHTYCVSCFAQHIRLNGNCPMCRGYVADKPKSSSMPTVTTQTIEDLVDIQMRRRYPERDDQNIEEYVTNIIERFYNDESERNMSRNYMKNKTVINLMKREFREYGLDCVYGMYEFIANEAH